jgi:hypothetical protein
MYMMTDEYDDVCGYETLGKCWLEVEDTTCNIKRSRDMVQILYAHPSLVCHFTECDISGSVTQRLLEIHCDEAARMKWELIRRVLM